MQVPLAAGFVEAVTLPEVRAVPTKDVWLLPQELLAGPACEFRSATLDLQRWDDPCHRSTISSSIWQ